MAWTDLLKSFALGVGSAAAHSAWQVDSLRNQLIVIVLNTVGQSLGSMSKTSDPFEHLDNSKGVQEYICVTSSPAAFVRPTPAQIMIRYIVPAHTRVAVARVARRRMDWRPHTTRRELQFERILKTDGGCVVFQFERWYVYVPRNYVKRVITTTTNV